MFENINVGEVYKKMKEEMTPLERVQHLATTNPMREFARHKKEQAWQNIRNYVDEYIKETKADYIDEVGEHYYEAMMDDQVLNGFWEKDKFRELMDEYFEWSL